MSVAATEKPAFLPDAPDRPCKLCGNTQGIRKIHYPLFVFRAGSFEAPPWFAHDKYYCPACHFLWTDAFDDLDLASYGKKYVENNYDHQRRPTESRMAFAPGLIAKLVRRGGPGRFLDYGCGYNAPYIYEMRARGFDIWGCDISAAVNYSRYIRRLPFEPFPDAFFDGIYSIDVMEHFADFPNDFREMTRILKPGGFMLHNTISLDNYWRGNEAAPDDPMVWAPWHCAVFSQKSADVLAKKVGLEFKGPVRTNSDTGLAFLFQKPGPVASGPLSLLSKAATLRKLAAFKRYFKQSYLMALTLPAKPPQA